MFDARPSGPRAYGSPYAPRGAAWTPRLVRETLVEAMRWARDTAGAVGPRGFARARGLAYTATLADHLTEGWGLPEEADQDEEAKPARSYTPEQIALYTAAIFWQGRYCVPANAGSSRMLGLWLRGRVHGVPVEAALREMQVSKAHAYRLRDRALSRIAQGLTADRVPVPGPITL